MKVKWNAEDVNPPGVIELGEAGIVIVRGVSTDAHRDAAADAIAKLKGDTPEQVVEAAVKSGAFVESAWGNHPAIEFVNAAEKAEKPSNPLTVAQQKKADAEAKKAAEEAEKLAAEEAEKAAKEAKENPTEP